MGGKGNANNIDEACRIWKNINKSFSTSDNQEALTEKGYEQIENISNAILTCEIN